LKEEIQVAKLNLLFIFTDEQRADTMAAYGNKRIETPSLNRLATEGVIFDQAYVTQPVCTPSRSSIMTGLYPHTNGCLQNNRSLPSDVLCLPEMLADQDYVTGYHGKWHLGDEIFLQHGFDEWVSIEDGYSKYYSPSRDAEARSSYHHFLIEQGFKPANGKTFSRHEAAWMPEEFSKPAFLAQEASRFIRENKDLPFVLYVNFFEPHMPFFGPRDDQYDPDRIPLPESFDMLPTEEQPLKAHLFQRAHYERGNHGLPLKTEADWRRVIANYWGLCSLVDTQVGQILKTLDESGLRNDTIIVYTSDHGDMMGSHRLLAKCVMFQEAVQVPLLMRLPGQCSSFRVRGPVSQIDLVPTLLDLMEQPIPDHLEGKSLKPLLEKSGGTAGSLSEHSENVFIEWNGPNNGFGDVLGQVSIPQVMTTLATKEEIERATRDPVRTVITPDGWKFNCSPLGEHELYNLNDDPLEVRNLAVEPEYQSLMQELAARIRGWQEETGDEVELPSSFTAPGCGVH
jgi:arylsulfatase A-like enzyme